MGPIFPYGVSSSPDLGSSLKPMLVRDPLGSLDLGSLWKEHRLGLVSHWGWPQPYSSDEAFGDTRTSVQRPFILLLEAVLTHMPRAALSSPPLEPQKEVQSYCWVERHSRVAARQTSPGWQCGATCKIWQDSFGPASPRPLPKARGSTFSFKEHSRAIGRGAALEVTGAPGGC